jgi:hypothetical protein
MIEGVKDCGIRHSVFAGRPMDFHIHNTVIRNSQEWKGSVIAWHFRNGGLGFDNPTLSRVAGHGGWLTSPWRTTPLCQELAPAEVPKGGRPHG